MFKVFDFNLKGDEHLRSPQVFTPPRDDFAGINGFGSNTPMSAHDRKLHQSIVTRQACCLLFRGASFFTCSLLTMSLFYTFVNFVVGEAEVINCEEQAIHHGIMMAGEVGSKPKIKCDGNYSLAAPVIGIKCRMISEKCVIKKHATVMRPAVRKCDRKYAFVSKAIEEKSLMNSNMSMSILDLMEEDAIPHACMSREELGLTTSRLYADRQPAHHLPRATTPMSASSIVTVTALLLMPLGLLVTAAVMQGRSTALQHRCYFVEPPSAEEEAMLLEADEDSIPYEESAFY